MQILIIIGVFILLIIFPKVRCFLFNLPRSLYYVVKDSIEYTYQKKKYLPKMGELVGYTGLFGKGKTLACVFDCLRFYSKYNDKKVYCTRRKKFVIHKVLVFSNVHLIFTPYKKLESLKQITEICQTIQEIDDINNTLTSVYVILDEASVQLNCRSFKDNINALFLNSLLTCRHYRLSIYYSTQRFKLVDALLRQVTSYVIGCDKFWRLLQLNHYDAWELENATSMRLVSPYRRRCKFVSDKIYNAYDTLQVVDQLTKNFNEGDMLSSAEILNELNLDSDNNNVVNIKRKYRKKIRK